MNINNNDMFLRGCGAGIVSLTLGRQVRITLVVAVPGGRDWIQEKVLFIVKNKPRLIIAKNPRKLHFPWSSHVSTRHHRQVTIRPTTHQHALPFSLYVHFPAKMTHKESAACNYRHEGGEHALAHYYLLP